MPECWVPAMAPHLVSLSQRLAERLLEGRGGYIVGEVRGGGDRFRLGATSGVRPAAHACLVRQVSLSLAGLTSAYPTTLSRSRAASCPCHFGVLFAVFV